MFGFSLFGQENVQNELEKFIKSLESGNLPFGKSKQKLKAISFCLDCVHRGWKSFQNPHFSRILRHF